MAEFGGNALEERAISLAAGTLRLRRITGDPEWPVERLCDFASRRNARRGFLIVSKVLGRHIPARPAEMRAAARALAERVPAEAPEPLLVVGLAETAVGLGQTVFDELLRLGRRAWFLHSTRQMVDHPLVCRFEEPHSHATAHLLYRPAAFDLAAVRTLVVVDDEVSTGTTLSNLAAALAGALPALQRIVVATLTDWSGNTEWLRRMPVSAQCVSLAKGQLEWEAGASPAAVDEVAAAPPPAALGRLPDAGPFGRLGVAEAMPFPVPDIAALDLPPGAALRVVGTGEFTYPPFLLAERLVAAGHDVVVQATSRSPVRLGGAMTAALSFDDNYGSGAGNYLYNARAGDGRLTLVCHETPLGSIDGRLLDALGARPVFFGAQACT